MTEFTYKNTKNINTCFIPFKFNYRYHSRISFEDEINPCLRSYSANKLAKKPKELMKICYKNLLYIQKLQKRAHNKEIKSHSFKQENLVE